MAGNNQSALARIEQAFAKFEQSVRSEDAKVFHQTQLSEVRQAAINIQEQQRRRGEFHNLRRIEPLLAGIEKYAKALDVLCNGTPFLAWIWAPIKLVLQLATEHHSSLESLLDAYARIAECLPRCDRYAKTIPSSEMQDVLALLYVDILDFHQRAYKFFRRRAWKILFDSTWVSFQQRFEAILCRLARHQELVDREAAAFDIVEATQARAKAELALEKSERERADQRMLSVLAWFGVTDTEQEDRLWHLQSKRCPYTCNWVLEDSKYRAWSSGSCRQAMLWLCGKPGSGKSVTCAFVVRQLREESNFNVLYYFMSHQSQAVASDCSHLLRVLGSQAIQIDTDLALLVWENYVRKGYGASLEHLHGVLPELISAIGPVRVVVDGVDEAKESEHRLIIDSLLRLTTGIGGHCNVLVCSRNVRMLDGKLRKCPTISFKDEKTSITRDIDAFVKSRLDDSAAQWDLDLTDDTKNVVIRELSRHSDGMFLWVDLVMNDWQYAMNENDILEAMNKLPKSLEEIYDRILQKIRSIPNSTVQHKVNHILEWLTYTTRPLKTLELLNAVGCYFLEDTQEDPTTEPVKLLEFCKPLIEFSIHGLVRFVHFSVKEYLLDQKNYFHIGELSANKNLAQTCLSYLRTSMIFTEPHRRTYRLLQIARGERSVHPYVFSSWLFHLEESGELESGNTSRGLYHLLETVLSQLKPMEPPTAEILIATASSGHSQSETLQFLEQIRPFYARARTGKAGATRSQVPSQLITPPDPSLLTQINTQYETDLEDLLGTNPETTLPPEITTDLLTAFRSSQSTAVFACRYANCDNEFPTISQRQAHEALHDPPFTCDVQTCAHRGRNFKGARQLASHKRRYHSESIPEIFLADVESIETVRRRATLGDLFPDFAGSDQNFNLDFSNLDNTDVLEDFDFDGFLNRTASDTFNFDEYTNPELPDLFSGHSDYRLQE